MDSHTRQDVGKISIRAFTEPKNKKGTEKMKRGTQDGLFLHLGLINM